MRRFENRLRRLETPCNGQFADVLSWIRAGRFFDELTEDEQKRYSQYYCGMDELPDAYFAREFGPPFEFDPHFVLEYKPKPLTGTEYQARIDEIQMLVEERSREYNSPENQEKRRREYEELQEIGRKRREAFYAGIPMDTYPLPWE